jgi:hypothetical protein
LQYNPHLTARVIFTNSRLYRAYNLSTIVITNSVLNHKHLLGLVIFPLYRIDPINICNTLSMTFLDQGLIQTKNYTNLLQYECSCSNLFSIQWAIHNAFENATEYGRFGYVIPIAHVAANWWFSNNYRCGLFELNDNTDIPIRFSSYELNNYLCNE